MPPAQTEETVLFGVGRRIAELRAELGLTQEGLAEQYGCTVTFIQRLERGTENVTVRTLVRVANVLGTGVSSLFDEPESRDRSSGGRPPSRSTP